MSDVLDASADNTGAEVELELIADSENLLKHTRKVNCFYDFPITMRDCNLLLSYDIYEGKYMGSKPNITVVSPHRIFPL